MPTQESVLSIVGALNQRYPHACSLSLGRPNPDIYARLDLERYARTYQAFLRTEKHYDNAKIRENLYTYGPSQGMITAHLAKWLANDEGIHAGEKEILVTNGCQEAYNLVLLHELRQPEDCVLIIEPSYFGFTDCVAVLGKSSVKIAIDDLADPAGGVDFTLLPAVIEQYRRQGKQIKLIYINPDFNNPMTYQLSEAEKSMLLAVCTQQGVKIIEDGTYSAFYYDGIQPRAIKTRDNAGQVYYIGSFSKTLCPSLRLGYLVISRHGDATFNHLLHIKDHTSLSSSALNQQIVAGFLIEHQYSLENWIRPIRDEYRARRDAMLQVLEQELDAGLLQWHAPAGGFFVYIRLPQEIDTAHLLDCAEGYQVTFLPVSYAVRDGRQRAHGIRLAFSYYPPAAIAAGTRKFCQFLNEKLLPQQI
ncbi:aminotransferase-like domain-containing protein [Serratia rhizosphaerae]|uniref:aminotransferase-like domain-containing protein n=1 Tax=Serratia rhizosphaerae TaxID=2597702 RepID=UPI002DBF8301|nr:PLP-dependent aminotransferase family protein [Serratia rhizosphaerae]MEB6336116.1 PLP-dependent aminotransferase family protein [Serratia rhizosphaerae]